MNLGKDASTFKYYTMCGLQEGFEPFAVNMNRDITMWFSKRLPTFVIVPSYHPHIEVIKQLHHCCFIFFFIFFQILLLQESSSRIFLFLFKNLLLIEYSSSSERIFF